MENKGVQERVGTFGNMWGCGGGRMEVYVGGCGRIGCKIAHREGRGFYLMGIDLSSFLG